MRETFVQKAFADKSLARIKQINTVLAEYEAAGYVLTLRQLYYQMVARGHIENTVQSYKRTVNLVGDARLAGLIDWAMITDRNRETISPPHWTSPAEIVSAAAEQFAIDKWADQPTHVEVMVEKDALAGVLIPVCRSLDVRFTANKGYNSLSNMHEAGKRIAGYLRKQKDVYILYLGDHDPSGIDMTRDVRERLEMFADSHIEVNRLALNYDQVEALNPPENPAKETDSRYQAYVLEFGESSWELDAIEPGALAELVTNAVEDLRDSELWKEAVAREADMREQLQSFADTYDEEDR
jgi:hypothetical protein